MKEYLENKNQEEKSKERNAGGGPGKLFFLFWSVQRMHAVSEALHQVCLPQIRHKNNSEITNVQMQVNLQQ